MASRLVASWGKMQERKGGRGKEKENGGVWERLCISENSLYCHTGLGVSLNKNSMLIVIFSHVIECIYLIISITNKPIEMPVAILFSIMF